MSVGTTTLGTRRDVAYDVALFIALFSTALALGGALAHLFELPNKIGLPAGEYFIVQKAYRGWNQLAYVLLVEFASIIAVVAMSWRRRMRRVIWAAGCALVFLVCAQVVFWTFTFPANVATGNWTVVPDNWEALRRDWEYSHAAGAVFQLLAMSSLIIAALGRPRDS